jgi:phage gpG-like protein
MRISWTIEGETQLSRKLIGLRDDLRDLRRPFSDSADYLKGVFSRDVFQTQGAAIGETWKRLSPYTVAQKARQGYPATPLVGSGRMQKSFQTIVSSDQAVIYNDAAYFKYHQSRAPRSHLPRRVMMKIYHRQREEVVRFFLQYIREGMRK